MYKNPKVIDLRTTPVEKKHIGDHDLKASIILTDNAGKYFCSCGALGSATGVSVEDVKARLIANYKTHAEKAWAWAARKQ